MRVLPLWQEIINQSQWIPIKSSETRWHNDFSPRFTCLPASCVPVVAIHSLRGSRANRHHTSNPQSGAAQPTQDEDPQASHAQSTRVPFGSPPGKGQEPLTITLIGARAKHLPLLNDPHCTKPSRWRQPPRVTSESRSKTQSPSASRCNHSKQSTWMLSNLTKWWINQARWVREDSLCQICTSLPASSLPDLWEPAVMYLRYQLWAWK